MCCLPKKSPLLLPLSPSATPPLCAHRRAQSLDSSCCVDCVVCVHRLGCPTLGHDGYCGCGLGTGDGGSCIATGTVGSAVSGKATTKGASASRSTSRSGRVADVHDPDPGSRPVSRSGRLAATAGSGSSSRPVSRSGRAGAAAGEASGDRTASSTFASQRRGMGLDCMSCIALLPS